METESQPKRLFQGTTNMLSTEASHLPELNNRLEHVLGVFYALQLK